MFLEKQNLLASPDACEKAMIICYWSEMYLLRGTDFTNTKTAQCFPTELSPRLQMQPNAHLPGSTVSTTEFNRAYFQIHM